jgi:radial spoke head protein 4A
MIKHIFSGNLNASIDSNPPFPGKERHLLRAQIGRITHATSISPKGYYEEDEETKETKFPEEKFELPATEELKSLEIWGHTHPIIL